MLTFAAVYAKHAEVHTFTSAEEVETEVFNGDDVWLVLFSKGACAACEDVAKIMPDISVPSGNVKVSVLSVRMRTV